MRTVRLLTALALTGGVLVACSGSPSTATTSTTSTPPLPPITPSPTSSTAPAAPVADWPTYHRDNARTGLASTLAPVGSSLRQAWRADLDGAVYGQPLVVGDLILAATENDTVYGLAENSGQVRWKTNVGTPQPKAQLPCGDISPLGITGTMAYDRSTGRVFAVAETPGGTHTLYGFDVVTGKVVVRTVVNPPKADPIAHQQRGALTVLDGRVYLAYGALAGDCSNYVGSVVSVTTDGTDPLSYAIPTQRQAGIWGPAGGTVADDTLLYSVGNGSSTTAYDGSDSVIALSPSTLTRVDYFAPSTWADDNATDLSLGSSNATLLGPWVYVGTKRTSGYVLRRGKLGGIGG
jgi:polyvinyl alcohol dehydrogenase (cytochrome)